MELLKTIIKYIPNRHNIYSDSDSESDIDIDIELDSDTSSQSQHKKDLEIVDDSVIPNTNTNDCEKNLHQCSNDAIIHLDYNSVYTLLNNAEIAHLPEIPKPFEKIQIINLGNKNVKIVSTNKTNIFNNFYAPNGNKSVLLQKNNSYDLIYIKTEEKSFWICK
jgi:hypothetical protein